MLPSAPNADVDRRNHGDVETALIAIPSKRYDCSPGSGAPMSNDLGPAASALHFAYEKPDGGLSLRGGINSCRKAQGLLKSNWQ